MKALHILLTLKCIYKCDHCFLFSGPEQTEVFSQKFLEKVIEEAKNVQELEWICFEGGEPFLYYPLMLQGIKKANSFDLKTALVTNGYWAAAGDAQLWLQPLKKAGLNSISISIGHFHDGHPRRENSQNNKSVLSIENAAEELEIDVSWLETKEPYINSQGELESGGVMFRGRAADELTENLPRKSSREFHECPWEDLETPERLHIDPAGRIHICQGIIIGEAGEAKDKSLAKLIEDYDPYNHPIIEPLIKGGPRQLAKETNYNADADYVDACHFCFEIRRKLLDTGKCNEYLAPMSVYDLSG